MKAWSASALRRYYVDPLTVFLLHKDQGPGAASGPGYYIVPHCDPDCCQTSGEISKAYFGPFATRAGAHEWSQTNLVETGGARR